MANPNETEYYTDERTINTATTNLPVRFGTVGTATGVIVTNRTTGYSMTVRFNNIANSTRTIDGGKSLIINDCKISSAWLSNASGASINFSVMVFGG